MREILFRGKRIDNGEMFRGNLLKLNKKTYLVPQNAWFEWGRLTAIVEVFPETLGEDTGLRDKNGKRIFEGDICRFREWSKGDMCWIGKVHYEHQQFVISGNPNKECESEFLLVMSRFISENIEVIGNIHDNPELLRTPQNDEVRG